MHDFQEQCQVHGQQCQVRRQQSKNAFVVIFFKTMYNKTIIRFGFCDIRNNQGLGKCYQPQLTTLTSTLISPDITKTSSNNCL